MADALDAPTATPSGRTSERHAFRPFSLIVGLITLAVAALFLIDDGDLLDVNQDVAGAVLVVTAGAALVIRTVLRLLGRRAAD